MKVRERQANRKYKSKKGWFKMVVFNEEMKYNKMVADATNLFEQKNAEILLFGKCLGFFGGDWENFGTKDQKFVNRYSVWVEGDRTFKLDYETGVLTQVDMSANEAEIIYSNM